MKKSAIGFCLGIIAMVMMASTQEIKKNHAEVTQLQGLFIFTDSKPMGEYEYLGTAKSKTSFSGTQYTDVRDRLIKKVKEDFPQAEGVIFNFKAGSTDTADAIKFKK